jgi:hypothetical protein
MPTGSDGRVEHAPCRSKIVPKILTADQKQHRVNVCTDLRQLAFYYEIYLCRVITGDKSWVYGYDPETKQQSFK